MWRTVAISRPSFVLTVFYVTAKYNVMKLLYWGMGGRGLHRNEIILYMLQCNVDIAIGLTVIPIFLFQWVSALEAQAFTFTLKDHKMATSTVSYSTSEKPELLHQKERTWSWRGWGKSSLRTLVYVEQMLNMWKNKTNKQKTNLEGNRGVQGIYVTIPY